MARTVNIDTLSEKMYPSKGGQAVRVMINGRRQTIWGRNKTECKKNVLEAIDLAKNGRRSDRDAPKNINEACDKLLEIHNQRASSTATLRSNLKAFRDEFGEWQLEELTFFAGQKWIVALSKRGLAPHTIRNYVKDPKRVLENAVANDWLDKNRWRTLSVDGVIDRPDPFDSWDEIFLISSCFPHAPFGQATRFAAGEALRPQEFLVFRECDVDRKRGLVSVRRTWDDELCQEVELGKTHGSLATIPLTEVGAEVLAEIPPSLHRDPTDWQNSPLLFPGPAGELVDPNRFRIFWKEAVRRSGVRYRPPKQLRHSFATLTLAAIGLEHMKSVSVTMRHDHVRTTERYYTKIVEQMLVKAGGKISTGMPSYAEFSASGAEDCAAASRS